MIEILLMEFFAAIFLLFSVFLAYEKGKIKNLQSNLNSDLTSASSFSLEWISGYRRKTLAATPAFMAATAFVTFGTGVIAFFLFMGSPKVAVITVVALGFFLDEEIFEALEYSRAVSKASQSNMNENDVKCVRTAVETLNSGVKRYVVYGTVFAFTGFFILQIFEAAIYGVALLFRLVPIPQANQITMSIVPYLIIFILALIIVAIRVGSHELRRRLGLAS